MINITEEKNTNKYKPGFIIGHSGRHKLNNIKFLIAQLILRKQIKILNRFAQMKDNAKNKIAKQDKNACIFICFPKVILSFTFPFTPFKV